MGIKLKKKNNEKSEEKQLSPEEVHELVYDIEAVKKAIETCIEFEKAEGIDLINKKGRLEFSKIYRKEEKKNRVKQMIRDEVQEQITPLNQKIDALISAVNKKSEIPKAREHEPTDEQLEKINKKK